MKGIIEKLKKNFKTLILIILLLLTFSGCVAFKILGNNQSTKSEEIVENDSCEIENDEIEVRKNGGLALDINTEEYTLPVILVNKKAKKYEKVSVKIEFYNEQGNVIKDIVQETEGLQANEEKEIVLECGKSDILIYSYKITEVKIEK